MMVQAQRMSIVIVDEANVGNLRIIIRNTINQRYDIRLQHPHHYEKIRVQRYQRPRDEVEQSNRSWSESRN